MFQDRFSSGSLSPSINLLAGYFQDILVDDEIWEQGVLESVEANGSTSLSPTSDFREWTALIDADFSRNDLPYIDESVVS